MHLALEGVNLGVWDWDMQTDAVDRDELLTEMLGYTPAEMDAHLPPIARIEFRSVDVRPDARTLYGTHASGVPPLKLLASPDSVGGLDILDCEQTGDTLRCDLLVASATPETLLVETGVEFDATVVSDGSVTVTGRVSGAGAVDRVDDAVSPEPTTMRPCRSAGRTPTTAIVLRGRRRRFSNR